MFCHKNFLIDENIENLSWITCDYFWFDDSDELHDSNWWSLLLTSSSGVHHLIRLIWPSFYCFDPSLTQHINSPITQPLNVPRNSLKLYSNLRFFLPKHNEVVLLLLLANFSRAQPSSPPSLQRLYGFCGYQRRIYILTRDAQWQKLLKILCEKILPRKKNIFFHFW